MVEQILPSQNCSANAKEQCSGDTTPEYLTADFSFHRKPENDFFSQQPGRYGSQMSTSAKTA
jgi:hypothetical protein